MDWLKKFGNGGDRGEAAEPLPGVSVGAGEELGTLNLQQAFTAHSNWRKRLEGILAGTNTERPEVMTVSVDYACDLGKWIHGDGKVQFQLNGKATPEFQKLVDAHAQFHLCAGEVLVLFNREETELAAKYLRKEFRNASDQVQLALVGLYAKARQNWWEADMKKEEKPAGFRRFFLS